jgi:heme/copper-type cytochrome/quinol oxidase subunit 2
LAKDVKEEYLAKDVKEEYSAKDVELFVVLFLILFVVLFLILFVVLFSKKNKEQRTKNKDEIYKKMIYLFLLK